MLPTSNFYSSIINRVFCEEKKKESLLLLSSFASCSIDVLTLSPWLRGAWPSGVRSQELHTAEGSVIIQTSCESVPSTPSWVGEVALIVEYRRRAGCPDEDQ